MFKRRVNPSYLLFIFFMAFFLSACNDNNKSFLSDVTPPSEVALDKIEITPTNLTVKQHSQQQFTAMGTYSDNTSRDLTQEVQWNSTEQLLSFDTNGLAVAERVGNTVITASYQSVVSNESLVVVEAVIPSLEVVLEKITITPANLDLNHNATHQFVATGTYSDGSTADISSQVKWHSTDNKLSFSATGLATAELLGDTSVTASYQSINSNESLIKVVAVLTSINILPEELTIIQHETQQFTAMGTYSDGSTMDLTELVSWINEDSLISFDENTKGLATFDQYGSTRVTASYESMTSSVSYVEIDQMFSFTNSAANLITLNQRKYETLPTITLTKQSETVNEKTNFKFTDVMIGEVTEQTITITNKTPQTVDKLFISYLKDGEKKHQIITLESPLSPYSVGVFSNEIIGGENLTIIHPLSLFLPMTSFTGSFNWYDVVVESCDTVPEDRCYGAPTPAQRIIFDVHITNMHNLFNQAEYPLHSSAFFASSCANYSECQAHTRDLTYSLYRYYQYAVEGHNLALKTLMNSEGSEGIGSGLQPGLYDGYSGGWGWLSIYAGYVTEGHGAYNPYSTARFKTIHHEGAHAYGFLSHQEGISYGLSEEVAYTLLPQNIPSEEHTAVKERKLPSILGVIDNKEVNTLHIKLFNNPTIAVEGQLAVAIDSPYKMTGKVSYNVATNMLTVKLTEKPQSIVYIRLYDSVTRSYQTTLRIKKEEWL